MLRAPEGGVEGKGPSVGKAVQHPLAPGQPGHRQAVVFLVQEKAGLLPVFHIHPVAHTIFADFGDGALRQGLSLQREPALVLLQALQGADGHIVALKEACDLLPVLLQHPDQEGEEHPLDALHPHGQGLGHQQRAKAVHRQPGEAVGLPKDHPAAGKILRPHDGLPVIPGVLEPPFPKGGVEPVVGVAGHQAQPDLALPAEKARAQIFPLFADGIGQRAVFQPLRCAEDLGGIDPGVAALHPARALFRDGESRIFPVRFHRMTFLFLIFLHFTTVFSPGQEKGS